MPIPEFNEIKAPALQFFTDGKVHKLSEVYETLANHFNVTQEEQSQMLPSGTQRRWPNRVNWACYDLFRAGVLDRPKKGHYVVTEAGQALAAQKPKRIDRDSLMQFPQFVKFLQTTGTKQTAVGPAAGAGQITDPAAKN